MALAGAGGRPYGNPVPDLIRHVHDQGKAVMVDIANLNEARAMEREGADLVPPSGIQGPREPSKWMAPGYICS